MFCTMNANLVLLAFLAFSLSPCVATFYSDLIDFVPVAGTLKNCWPATQKAINELKLGAYSAAVSKCLCGLVTDIVPYSKAKFLFSTGHWFGDYAVGAGANSFCNDVVDGISDALNNLVDGKGTTSSTMSTPTMTSITTTAPCPENKYDPNNGRCCPSGYLYSRLGKCCPPGLFYIADNPGYHPRTRNRCISCSAGKYYDGHDGCCLNSELYVGRGKDGIGKCCPRNKPTYEPHSNTCS